MPSTTASSWMLPDNPWRGLWQLMRGRRLAYLGATLSLALAALAKTATFLWLRYFADLVNGTAPMFAHSLRQTFAWLALIFLGLAVLQGGFSFLSGWLAAYVAESVARDLRDHLLDHIQRLSFAYHSRTATGGLIERATSDVDAVRRFFSDQATSAGRILLLFVINFAAIYRLYPPLAFASVAVMPFILLVSVRFFRRVSTVYEAYQKQEARLSTVLQENLNGVQVVKAFGRQAFEIARFEDENRGKYRLGKRLIGLHSLFWPTTDVVLGLQMIGGFIYAAFLVMDGRLTVGGYLAYVGLVEWLIWPIRNLGRLIVQASTGLVSYRRLVEVLREPQEDLEAGEVHPTHPPRGDLVFEHVGFHYEDSRLPALEDITFAVQAGQVVAIMGNTGSGKTTLVNLLPRFYEYTEGRILLDGVELTRYPKRYLRRHIGIVEQEPFLFSRTIRENLTYGVGREVSQEDIEQAARAAAIHEVIQSFPDGYDTLVGEKGVTLSGGQKQRITIARTLLQNPRILILDDSTSSVDTETEADIRAALQRLMGNRTILIITHRVQSAMHADLILVLHHGRIVQRGTHAELISQEGIYREMYRIQRAVESDTAPEGVPA